MARAKACKRHLVEAEAEAVAVMSLGLEVAGWVGWGRPYANGENTFAR